MRGGSLRYGRFGIGFNRVGKIGELHRIFDDEYPEGEGKIIIIPLLSIKLSGEAANIDGGVLGTLTADEGGEPDEGWGFGTGFTQKWALVTCRSEVWSSNSPCTPKPRAWTTFSGMRSRLKCDCFR